MAEIKANLPQTYFAWSGATKNGGLAYYRVQGPTVVIEYAPQQGDLDHIHTIYRDPTNDYGAKLVKTMNVRRFLMPFAVLGAWLATVHPAGAHRVDEYLQATRLSIDIERVDLEIDLTAGVALASKVFGWIDTNRDGEISSAEGEAYARQMLRSVVLKVDGWPVPIQLVEHQLPAISRYEPRRWDDPSSGNRENSGCRRRASSGFFFEHAPVRVERLPGQCAGSGESAASDRRSTA